MSTDHDKAKAFVGRLLQNPSLRDFSELQREEQIIQFLHVNAAQLGPTLSTQQFFAGKNWNQIFSILLNALYELVNDELLPKLEELIRSKLDLAFLRHMRQTRVDDELVQKQLIAFATDVLKKPDARRNFTGAYSALVFGIADRYLTVAFDQKKYVHFELTKVQRLRMNKEETRNFVRLTLLLRPIVNLGMSTAATQQERSTGMVQSQFAEKVMHTAKSEMKYIPEQALKSAVDASLSFNENRFVEATSRLAAIFAARSRSYQPNMRVDRGADSPDKSWISVSRRNYKYYGFDIKMLDELYKIAAENNW